jgi:erythromycin esterase-like protein
MAVLACGLLPSGHMFGDAHFALLGEASHGTHDFYHERALITQRLIAEKDFTAVAVTADWPDAYRVNRYVQGLSDDASATDALAGFRRFPLTWRADQDLARALHGPRLERAIGVIYRLATERASHYFDTQLPEQFDAVLHFDETSAVEPLERTATWERDELPETFPFAVRTKEDRYANDG